MSNLGIIILSFTVSGIIVAIINLIRTGIESHTFNKEQKRFEELQKLVSQEQANFIMVDIDDTSRINCSLDKDEVIIDGKVYNDKNYFFRQMDKRIYILGKKENVVVALISRD